MLGPAVSTIPSHGAVARSVAAETHTGDFPAWNLRLTFNLPSFTTSTVNYLGAVRSTARHLSYFSSTSTSNCFAVYIRSVLELYFSPWKEILLDPLASAIVGSKFGSIYNRITVKHFSLCLFVTNCQTCINRLLHPRCPDSVCPVSKHCCTPLPHQTKHFQTYLRSHRWLTNKECTLN